MEKLGIISDIHGNIQALKTVMKYFEDEGISKIIHTGDVLDIGANSAECLAVLKKENVLCLMGNHDRDFVLKESLYRKFSHVSAEHKQYVFAQSEKWRSFVESFPVCYETVLGGKKIMFEHYCRPQEQLHKGVTFAPFASKPTAEIFDEMYRHYDCDIVFFGHKHEPCDIKGAHRLYVDVGSVGCHPEPLACGIVAEFDESHFDYHRFALPYPQKETQKAMTKGDLPHGEYLFDFYYMHRKDLPKPFGDDKK